MSGGIRTRTAAQRTNQLATLRCTLGEVSGLKLESSQTRFSTLIFPFYKKLFMNRFEFSRIADFFARIFKARVEYGFL